MLLIESSLTWNMITRTIPALKKPVRVETMNAIASVESCSPVTKE